MPDLFFDIESRSAVNLRKAQQRNGCPNVRTGVRCRIGWNVAVMFQCAIPRPKTGYGRSKVYASRFMDGRTYR
jgi:hypothetical protein